MAEMTKAVFIRKAANVRELMDEYFAHREDQADPFTVEKVIVLSDSDYQGFARHGLMQDVEYIFDNRTITGQDPHDRCWHCLLIKGQTLAQGGFWWIPKDIPMPAMPPLCRIAHSWNWPTSRWISSICAKLKPSVPRRSSPTRSAERAQARPGDRRPADGAGAAAPHAAGRSQRPAALGIPAGAHRRGRGEAEALHPPRRPAAQGGGPVQQRQPARPCGQRHRPGQPEQRR